MADGAIEHAVQIERINRVAWVVLDRPGQINAINSTLRREAVQALELLDNDPDIGVIVIRGAGERGFCAGADIKSQSDATSLPALRNNMTPGWIEVLDQIRKPVIAAIHGYCLGGGLEISLACDFRVAAPNAVFGLPETGLGLIPGGGGTQSHASQRRTTVSSTRFRPWPSVSLPNQPSRRPMRKRLLATAWSWICAPD